MLSPAIVFKDSKDVTYTNRYKYVTKLASDAQKEYDVAMYIKSKCPHDGIYPVDNLECGIGPSSVGDYESWSKVYDRCEKQEKLLKRKSVLCAIQYPKYTGTFEVLRLKSNSHIVEEYLNLAYFALCRLHGNNIFHLDIKESNISYTHTLQGNDIRFADWGFTRIVPEGKILREKFSTSPGSPKKEVALKSLEHEMYGAIRPINYYEESLFPKASHDLLSRRTMSDILYHLYSEVVKNVATTHEIELRKVRTFFLFIDTCCFCGMQSRLLPAYYDEFLRVIAELVYEPYYINDKAEQILISKWIIPLDGVADSILKQKIHQLYVDNNREAIFNSFQKP